MLVKRAFVLRIVRSNVLNIQALLERIVEASNTAENATHCGDSNTDAASEARPSRRQWSRHRPGGIMNAMRGGFGNSFDGTKGRAPYSPVTRLLDDSGESLLNQMIQAKKYRAAAVLLNSGANANTMTTNGKRILETLLENINEATEEESEAEWKETHVEFLLRWGANPFLQNDKGTDTPHHP